MMETIGMIYGSYKNALSYEKKKEDRKWGRSYESLNLIEKRWPNVVRDGITTTINGMARVADLGVCAGSLQPTLRQDWWRFLR